MKNRSHLPLPGTGDVPVRAAHVQQDHLVPPADPRPAPPGPDVLPVPIQDPPAPQPPGPIREPPAGNPPTTAAALRRVAQPQGTYVAH